MRKLVTILIKVLKRRVCSGKRNIASEENDNKTNIEEKKLRLPESRKVAYGSANQILDFQRFQTNFLKK